MLPWSRHVVALLAVLLLGLGGSPTALAQATDPAPAPAVRASSADDPAPGRGQDVMARLETPGGAGSSRMSGPPSRVVGFGAWLVRSVTTGLALGIEGIATLPNVLDDLSLAWFGLRNVSATTGTLAQVGTTLGMASATVGALALIGATVGIALGLGLLARGALGAALRRPPPSTRFLARFGAALRGGLADLVGLAVFGLVAMELMDRWLPEPDIAQFTARDMAYGVVWFWLYWMGARFLLSPGRPDVRLLPIRRPDWYYRLTLIFAALSAVSYMSVTLVAKVSPYITVEGWYFVTTTVQLVLKLWWFWAARGDVAALLQRDSGDQPAPRSRRVAGALVIWALIAVAVFNWLMARFATAFPEFGWYGVAVAVTQVAVVLLPITAAGADALIAEGFGARDPAATPLRSAAIVVGRMLARGGVWVLGLYGLAQFWGDYLEPLGSGAQSGLRELVTIAVAIVAGWTVWSFTSAYLSAHAPKARASLPGVDDEVEEAAETRLATALPLVRGTMLVAVVGVTALVVLSTLDVNIGPLLAGFGVLGLAISFGSQALVRDIVSGIFFMIDDAFRVGEYIDTGRLKGTVEKITVRSVQLRHQSGLVHTIPFGQLQSVTNASRDWATVKFNIRLEHGSDLEKTRKIIKRVGQDMLADPELAGEIILPLKLQGVADITEGAIVCRLKVTAKPARASWVQRDALKRVYRALEEGGVVFASGVMVKSLDGDRQGVGIAGGAITSTIVGGVPAEPGNVAR